MGLDVIRDFVWGLPLITLIFATGIMLTVKLRLIQAFQFKKAIGLIFKKDNGSSGDISSFGALCTTLSATIGTGNIIGVASAISLGGPGALFWVELSAFFGMATKYAEGFLAVKYRRREKDGSILGGPFCYIEDGMGKKYKPLALMFAFCGTFAGLFGIGTIAQVNGITEAVTLFSKENFLSTISIFGKNYYISTVVAGGAITLFSAMVLVGGIKRISAISEILVPFMAISYFVSTFLIIVFNLDKLPFAIRDIFVGAFCPRSVTGGAVGSVFIVIQNGISRGIFSNEAGLGSTPIACAGAKTNFPPKQGLINMSGTFFDTFMVCTMTGLSIIITDAWKAGGLKGIEITAHAFKIGLPFDTNFSMAILTVCLICFAFTSILGWNYYSEKCLQYIVGNRTKILSIFKFVYIFAIFIGPYISVETVWKIADILNGLMAFPNLVAIFALRNIVCRESKNLFNR